MKSFWTLITIVAFSALVFAQTSTNRPREVQPKLQIGQTKLECEDADAEGLIVTRCSGENVRLQLAPNTPLHLTLDSFLLTRGLKDTTLMRTLVLQSPIESQYWGKYAERDTAVLTRITGHESGFKKRALLEIEPRHLKLYVSASDYVAFAMKNGQPLYLKPGIWDVYLSCSIKQIVTPDGQAWTRKDDAETNVIRNDRFGLERQTQPLGDMLTGIGIFPGGPTIYAISQFKDLWKFLTHRPNMSLPTGTDFYFTIDGLSATYISPLAPIGPATVIKKGP